MRLLLVGVTILFFAALVDSCSNCCTKSCCSSGGQSNCCTKSCCDSGTQSNCCTKSCCGSGTQSNCCTKSCCDSGRQSNCCTKSCCDSGRQSNCCTRSCCSSGEQCNCCTKPETEPLQSTTSRPTSPTSTTPTVAPVRPQPTSSPMVVNISNDVHNENRIETSISLHLSNAAYINVNAVRDGSNDDVVIFPTTTSRPIPPGTTPHIPTIPTIYPSTPTTNVPTTYLPTQFGCCYVIQPCYLNICRQYSCGSYCTHPVVFKPVNPCPVRGCYGKSIWSRQYCGYGSQCEHVQYDCSLCDVNTFYQNYDSYSACYGCFY